MVTSDNPRWRSPAAILHQILQGTIADGHPVRVELTVPPRHRVGRGAEADPPMWC